MTAENCSRPANQSGTRRDRLARPGGGQGDAGGEQAANALPPGSSSRHATTANAKVRGAIEASPLVTRWRCLRSHSSDRNPGV
jgi:hypothetical protein